MARDGKGFHIIGGEGTTDDEAESAQDWEERKKGWVLHALEGIHDADEAILVIIGPKGLEVSTINRTGESDPAKVIGLLQMAATSQIVNMMGGFSAPK